MKRIHDSSQVRFAGRAPMSDIQGNNFKTLDVNDALLHLKELKHMLSHMWMLFEQDVIHTYYNHHELREFAGTLLTVINVLQKRIERTRFLDKESIELSIDPTESGLPVFVRDFLFLNKERLKAKECIDGFSKDKQLVDDALFSLFRGVFPADIVEAKMTKSIYRQLLELPELKELRFHKPVSLGTEGSQLFQITIERLEETYNIPRLYTVHFSVPTISTFDETLADQLNDAFIECTKLPLDKELAYMADHIESISGISVHRIQRIDIGPFYNRFTENPQPVADLLSKGEEGDSILLFRMHSLHRVSETQVSGIGNWFKALASGDWRLGSFSRTLISPTYLILPHRLIQKAHYHDIQIDEHVKMFGLSARGGLFESTK